MRNEVLKPGLQTHVWEVWFALDNEIHGRIIEEWRPAQLARLYDYNYTFAGREYIYHICSHDAVPREAALWFAKEVHAGKIRRLSVDLAEIQGKRGKK